MPKINVKKTGTPIDYFVSGIWMDNHRNITHFLLHEVDEKGLWLLGKKTSADEILQLLDDGKIIRSIRWNYVSAKWTTGVMIKVATKQDGSRFLKSASDHVVTDNLEHLVRMMTIVE